MGRRPRHSRMAGHPFGIECRRWRRAPREGGPMSDLTPRQERFIQEYLVGLNGTQAAIRAGYSEHTATAIAWELLRNPEVEAAIAEAQTKRGEKAELPHPTYLSAGPRSSRPTRTNWSTTAARHADIATARIALTSGRRRGSSPRRLLPRPKMNPLCPTREVTATR
jgi:Terminase small subunit